MAETDRAHAFRNLNPIRPEHRLVIPKAHHLRVHDRPPADRGAVMDLAQRAARRPKAMTGVERVALALTGIHVPHAHAPLMPMHHVHDVTSAAFMADGRGATPSPRARPRPR